MLPFDHILYSVFIVLNLIVINRNLEVISLKPHFRLFTIQYTQLVGMTPMYSIISLIKMRKNIIRNHHRD